MQGWKKNRVGLGVLLLISSLVANYDDFSEGQKVSLIALLVLVYYLYVKFLNNYPKA